MADEATLADVVAELRGMRTELNAQGETLREHSRLLAEHSTALREQSKLLGQHSGELAGIHGDIAAMREDIQALPDKFVAAVREQLQPVARAQDVTNNHVLSLARQVGGLEARVQLLERKKRPKE